MPTEADCQDYPCLEMRHLLRLGPTDPVPSVAWLANAEDEDSGVAHEVFAFRKPFGEYGTVRVPRAQALFEPDIVARLIAGKNGLLPRDRIEAQKLIQKACGIAPREHWLEISTEGWRSDLSAFVHRGRIIGKRRKSHRLLKAPPLEPNRSYILKQKGQLKQWKQLSRLARQSSRMRLTICAAFAAPLLRIVDLQSFMLVIFGPSKAGKSTVQLAAASMIGIGDEGSMPNFNSTSASLQEVAVGFNDLVMPVNEIGLLAGAKKDAYSILRPLIYRYAEGRDTGRHTKSKYAATSGLAAWRGILVASSENSVEALAALAGLQRDEGEYARAFDVPAVRPGNTTVYDRFPRGLALADRESWARQRLVSVRELCAANHGVAFGQYAKFLVENEPTIKLEIKRAMRKFMVSLHRYQLSGAFQHAAKNFALIYAGAVIAKRAGLLPWSLTTTQAALRTCFLDGLSEIKRGQGAEEQARAVILERLGSLPPISSISNSRDVEGWYKDTGEGRIFTIPTPRFREWFPKRDEERAALLWLHRSQLLKPKDRATPDWPNLEWAVTWHRIKRKGHRCYQFYDPRRTER